MTRRKWRKLSRKPVPNKLSELIEVAVADAQRLSKLERFRLDMSVYNNIEGYNGRPERCHVCLGGAAIVGRGLAAPGEGVTEGRASRVAVSLNEIRLGRVKGALLNWYKPGLEFEPLKAEGLRVIEHWISNDIKGRKAGKMAKFSTYLRAAKALKELGY